jgi:hypothetical protein
VAKGCWWIRAESLNAVTFWLFLMRFLQSS